MDPLLHPFTAVNPVDPLLVVPVIALVGSVVGEQTDDAALGLYHHPCLPCHVLANVNGAVSHALDSALSYHTLHNYNATPSTLAKWAIYCAEMILFGFMVGRSSPFSSLLRLWVVETLVARLTANPATMLGLDY